MKRHVKFEDGKVYEDSGPIVSTASMRISCFPFDLMLIDENFHSATEDTDKVESEQTEVRTKALF